MRLGQEVQTLPRLGRLTPCAALQASTRRAEALACIAEAFEDCGIEDPRREAGITLAAASGLSPLELIVAPREPLGSAAPRVWEFAARRATGEPLSRIVGKRQFWSLELAISPQVLDPRPETETIVETSLRLLGDRRGEPLHILDLGVGSGALLCALLSEFAHARGVGVDISAGAVDNARGNIEACGLAGRAEIKLGDWTRGLKGPFDLVVSNPPYIPSADLPGLPREVRNFDPRIALDGGIEGLDAYRRLVPDSCSLLPASGWLIVEVGAGQASDVLTIADECGFADASTARDLAGRERAVTGRRTA
jgi:release factor glutamine methyltransferase